MTKVPDDEGFTLTETLMALVVISIALAAIVQAAGYVAGVNTRAKAASAVQREIRNLHQTIESGLGPLQPITDDNVSGNSLRIDFACGLNSCRIDAGKGRVFRYIGGGEVQSTWPPSGGIEKTPPLEGVIVQSRDERSLDVIKFRVEQDRDCQFDFISRTCRASGPE